jgi:ABC-type uncharacterized transport system involved in gliding motility auxiliary subunit
MASKDEERSEDEVEETESSEVEDEDKVPAKPAEEPRAKRSRLSARGRREAKRASRDEEEAPASRRRRRARREAERSGEWGVWPSLCLVATILVIAFGIIVGLVAKNTKGSPWVTPAVNFGAVIFWLFLAYYTYRRDLGRVAGLLLGLGAYRMLGALVAWLVTDSPPMAIVLAGLGLAWFAVGGTVAVKWDRERSGRVGGALGMRTVEAEELPPFEWSIWVSLCAAVGVVLVGAPIYFAISRHTWVVSILEFLVAALFFVLAYSAGRRAVGLSGALLLGAGGFCTISAMVAWLVTGGESVYAILVLLGEGLVFLTAGGILLGRAPGRTWASLGRPLMGVAALTLFVGILALINFVTVRYGGQWKWDSTSTKYYSLSDLSRSVVRSLDQPVEIIGFYTAGPYSQAADAERLYRQYADISSKLRTAMYDPRLDLAEVKKYNPPSSNVTIVKCGDRRKEIYTVDEQDITSAILEVTEKEKKTVYFLEGHGERAIEGGDPSSYTYVVGKLKDLQYDVKPLNLMTSGSASTPESVSLEPSAENRKLEVPADCSVLAIVGPTTPISQPETNAINDYVDKGGHAFIAIGATGDPDLHQILSPWDVRIGAGYVIDPQAAWFGSVYLQAFIPTGDSPILKDLRTNRVPVVFPLPRPVETTEAPPPESPYGPPPPQNATELVESSPDSWEETNITANTTEVRPNPEEKRGPLGLCAIVDAPPKTGPDANQEPEPPSNPWEPPKDQSKGKARTRMVVLGTPSIADDEHTRQLQSRGNEMLFLNSINWLAERTKLISLPPKERGEHQLQLTGNVRRFVMLLSLILTPLCIAIVGGIVWWVRR